MNVGGWTFRAEYVRCGKPSCRACPHGPYWYAYRHRGARMEKRYHGKLDPRPATTESYDQLDRIFSRTTATEELAWQILGIPKTDDFERVRTYFDVVVRERYPDRGGDFKDCQRLIAAFSYLKALNKGKL